MTDKEAADQKPDNGRDESKLDGDEAHAPPVSAKRSKVILGLVLVLVVVLVEGSGTLFLYYYTIPATPLRTQIKRISAPGEAI